MVVEAGIERLAVAKVALERSPRLRNAVLETEPALSPPSDRAQ